MSFAETKQNIIILCSILLLTGSALGDDPCANLNGYDSIDQDVGHVDLFVNTDGETVEAEDMDIVQGDLDTMHGVVGGLSCSTKKKVAWAVKKTGPVLYRVEGRYATTGNGTSGTTGGEATWQAEYGHNGDGDTQLRMLLSVNGPSSSDDFVAVKNAYPGATLTIKLVGTQDDQPHTITFDCHQIAFSDENPVLGMVNGEWEDEVTINLKGVKIGECDIWATSPGVQRGKTSATVYEAAFLYHGSEKISIDMEANSSSDAVELVVYGSSDTNPVPLTMKKYQTASCDGEIPGHITVHSGENGGYFQVFGPGDVRAARLVINVSPSNGAITVFLKPKSQ